MQLVICAATYFHQTFERTYGEKSLSQQQRLCQQQVYFYLVITFFLFQLYIKSISTRDIIFLDSLLWVKVPQKLSQTFRQLNFDSSVNKFAVKIRTILCSVNNLRCILAIPIFLKSRIIFLAIKSYFLDNCYSFHKKVLLLILQKVSSRSIN